MKKHIIAYTCLLALNIYAAEEKQQQITIYNKDFTTVKIDLDIKDLATGKDLGCIFNNSESEIPFEQQKTFDLIDKEKQYKKIVTLCLPDTVIPQYVVLDVTEQGNVRPGDTITITPVGDKYKNIEIRTMRSNKILLCKSCIQPIIIGSDPASFPNSIATAQAIHIANTDLYQVSVVIESLRKSFSKPKNHMLSNSYVSNEIAEQTTTSLEKRDVRCFLIKPSKDENITKRLKLIIPEAKQEVLVNINEGEINSGDILQVCWSEDKQNIEIKKLFPNSTKFALLACLHSRKIKNLTATFG